MKQYIYPILLSAVVGIVGWGLTGRSGFGVLMFVALSLGYILGRRRMLRQFQGDENAERHEEKEEKKEKILEYFKERGTSDEGRVTNNDIQKLLGVSDASATNYPSELEAEGKIRQIGNTGRGVEYELSDNAG